MIANRAGLVAILFLVVVASCSLPRPMVGLAIAGTSVPGSREGSFCQSGGCGGACGDGPAPTAPLTIVRTSAPVRLDFSGSAEINQIHGAIYRGETMSGQPIESFDLGENERSYSSQVMRDGPYYLLVLLRWSRFTDRGDSSLAFSVEIVPP